MRRDRSHLPFFFGGGVLGGGVRKEVEPTGMLPNDKLVVLKRKEKKL